MARYACIKTADGSFFLPERFREFATRPEDLPAKGLRWLPATPAVAPTYDPATQVLVGPSYTVAEDSVEEGWAVRAKTAQELDAGKSGRVSALDALVLEILFDTENRVRALEGRPPVTRAQYRAALKERL